MVSNLYYAKLGLTEHASFEEVKKRYHELTKKYHPDNFGDEDIKAQKQAEATFKEINEAYLKIKNDYNKKSQNANKHSKFSRDFVTENNEKAFDEFVAIYPSLEKQLQEFGLYANSNMEYYLNPTMRGKINQNDYKKIIQGLKNMIAFYQFKKFYAEINKLATQNRIFLTPRNEYLNEKNRANVTPDEYIRIELAMGDELRNALLIIQENQRANKR